jgi:carbamoyltransferase
MSNIIGLSAHFHDAACCLLQDGVLIAAAEEERFSRRKHDPDMPKAAFAYCLRTGGISIDDVDCVAFYERPTNKLARQICAILPGTRPNFEVLSRLDPLRPEREIREILGYEGIVTFFGHHEAHAASAFLFSGFTEAAVLTVDGVGEFQTTTYGRGYRGKVEAFDSVDFPDSLGLLYSAVTGYLGFEVNEGEYKVMGLAPYGKPIYQDRIRSLITSLPRGQYRLNASYFDFQSTDRMHSDEMVSLFGIPARQPGEEILESHTHVARSLQFVLEEILLEKVVYLHDATGSENLCMAGGVALNCVANSQILRKGPFRHLFVQPAAGDAGGCLGAAALAAGGLTADVLSNRKLEHVFFGPSYTSDDIGELLESAGLLATDFRGREVELLKTVAGMLADKKVIAWFQGHMEFGPRSLGGRSILADPREAGMRERINSQVKKREAFRPFAPAVLESRAKEHFKIDHPSPFMLETFEVISPLALPAITHIDGSARVQTVEERTNGRFARLLKAFEECTGCPILLNTSFNLKDEPIVCSPADALVCFIRSEIDTLVLQDFVIHRAALGPIRELLFKSVRLSSKPSVSHGTYTFL